MTIQQVRKRIDNIPLNEFLSEDNARFLKTLTYKQYNQLSTEQCEKLRIVPWRYEVHPKTQYSTRYYRMLLEDCPEDAWIIDRVTREEVSRNSG